MIQRRSPAITDTSFNNFLTKLSLLVLYIKLQSCPFKHQLTTHELNSEQIICRQQVPEAHVKWKKRSVSTFNGEAR